jgi:5'-nucleotidase
MLILLTNDDGIFAPGLAAMHRELSQMGEVHVVAPDSVQSAAGHGITLHSPMLTTHMKFDGFEGIAVDGRPADCVKLAVSQILPRPPDLVVSGINSGANVGINVIYSGTVAAAIEGAFLGIPSIAASLYMRKEFQPDYATAAKWTRDTIEKILAAGLGRGQMASINLPGLPPGETPKGVKVVRQCVRPWNDTYDRRTDPRGRVYYWCSSVFKLGATEDDTDVAALKERYITITPLQFDLTDYDVLRDWQRKLGENV